MNLGDIMGLGAKTAAAVAGHSVVFTDTDGSTRTILVSVVTVNKQLGSDDERRNVTHRIRVTAMRDATTGINSVSVGRQVIEWTPPAENSPVKYTVVGLVSESEGHLVVECERQATDAIRQRGRIAERMGAL